MKRCRSQLKISSEIRIDRKIDRIDLAFRRLRAALWPVRGAKCTAGTAAAWVRRWRALCGPVLPRECGGAGPEGPSFKAKFTLSSISNKSANLKIRKSATLTIPTSPRCRFIENSLPSNSYSKMVDGWMISIAWNHRIKYAYDYRSCEGGRAFRENLKTVR